MEEEKIPWWFNLTKLKPGSKKEKKIKAAPCPKCKKLYQHKDITGIYICPCGYKGKKKQKRHSYGKQNKTKNRV
jgi:ribosomal protein L37AE/L43A